MANSLCRPWTMPESYAGATWADWYTSGFGRSAAACREWIREQDAHREWLTSAACREWIREGGR